MRFAIYLTLLMALLPLVLTRPFFGLCTYYVISLLQPKLLAWAPSFPDAMLVGVPLVIGAISIGVKRKAIDAGIDRRTGRVAAVREYLVRSPIFEPSWLLGACLVLFLYISVNRLMVPTPTSNNSFQYRSLCKVLLVMALLTGLASDYRRFRALYIVVAMSVAFWAIKGGLKVMVLGPHQVYGKTFDNNLFALTSVMTLPMLFYFALSLKHKKWRTVLMVCSALVCLSVIGSRSRAGFVAFGVVLLGMAWSSRYRFRAMIAVGLMGTAALTMAGTEIKDRIDSILAYRQDKSAQSRFFTWDVAMRMLGDNPVIGVGFANFEAAKDELVGGRKAAHNIYLQNLAELGLLGHPIWLTVVFGSVATAYLLMRRARQFPPDLRWVYHWSRGLFLGLLAFCIHGAFHNEEYLELMFVMVGLVAALQTVTRRELRRWRLDQQTVSAPAAASPVSRPAAFHPGQLVISS